MVVANTTMWNNKPSDASPMIDFQEKMAGYALSVLDDYRDLGATEQDIANAIHYIDQVYAIPPIKDDIYWFKGVLDAVLAIAFPNGGIGGGIGDSAAEFGKRLIIGIEEQLAE